MKTFEIYRHGLTALEGLSLLWQTLHHEAWPENDLGTILTFSSKSQIPILPLQHKQQPTWIKLQREAALMKARWRMLQLKPHFAWMERVLH